MGVREKGIREQAGVGRVKKTQSQSKMSMPVHVPKSHSLGENEETIPLSPMSSPCSVLSMPKNRVQAYVSPRMEGGDGYYKHEGGHKGRHSRHRQNNKLRGASSPGAESFVCPVTDSFLFICLWPWLSVLPSLFQPCLPPPPSLPSSIRNLGRRFVIENQSGEGQWE